ncbi:MAG: xanthine dehydrogenase family protein subunit M [Gemmatimonadetes bacterium]|nr:xanthine dehydrogenase family protein subunit M [Gemmatimonadota bacterium]
MKPAPFAYHRPSTTDEAVSLLAEHGWEAKLLAGGQSLIPAMNFRLAQPGVLIDLNNVEELAYIRDGDVGLHIGAMTRQRSAERSELVAARAPLVHEALPFVAHPQIRSRGTIGGSIAHADPASEMPAVTLALEARFHLRSPRGARSVSADEFFTGLFGTALESDELLAEIEIPPLADGAGWAFAEISRRHGDYGLAGLAAAVQLDGDGKCSKARLALLSVGDGPVLATSAAETLIGAEPSEEAIRAAANAAAHRDIDPPSDIHASAAYRRRLVEVLTRRVLPRAFDRARGVDPKPTTHEA